MLPTRLRLRWAAGRVWFVPNLGLTDAVAPPGHESRAEAATTPSGEGFVGLANQDLQCLDALGPAVEIKLGRGRVVNLR